MINLARNALADVVIAMERQVADQVRTAQRYRQRLDDLDATLAQTGEPQQDSFGTHQVEYDSLGRR